MFFRSVSLVRIAVATGCLLVLGVVSAATASAAELTIRFCGLENRSGTLRISVFSKEHAKEFTQMKSEAYAVGMTLRLADLEESSAVKVVLPRLQPGEYAVHASHDENGNGEFDLGGLVGTPQEAYGYSRNARARISAVEFSDAAFTLGNEPMTIDIRMAHWRITGGDSSPCPP